MKHLILVRGLPGSGKTTFAELLDELSDVALYSADYWFYNEQGEYVFDATKLDEAHSNCIGSVEFDMADGISPIIVHNTLTTEAEVLVYTKLAEKYGYQVTSLIVENRHGSKSVHLVPDSTLEKMRRRFSIKL